MRNDNISRELARNHGEYLPSKAQARYLHRRKKFRPHKMLANADKLQDNLSGDLCGNVQHAGTTTFNRKSRRDTQTSAPWQNPNQQRIVGKTPLEANEHTRFRDCEADIIFGFADFGGHQAAMIKALTNLISDRENV